MNPWKDSAQEGHYWRNHVNAASKHRSFHSLLLLLLLLLYNKCFLKVIYINIIGKHVGKMFDTFVFLTHDKTSKGD